jgi:hypothetical protein
MGVIRKFISDFQCLTKLHTIHPRKYKNKSQRVFNILSNVQCSWTSACFPSFLRKLRPTYLICMQCNVVLCSMVSYGALQCCRIWYEVVYEAVLQWDVMWYAVWCNLCTMMQCKCNCIVSCHNQLAKFIKLCWGFIQLQETTLS